jgi:histidyl-tRNA synthetase
MNPEVKKIGNKLFDKVELAQHKVELTVVSDLEKLLKEIKSLNTPISQNIDKLMNLDKLLKDEKELSKNNLNKLNSAYEKAVVLVDKLKQTSKELGIDIPLINIANNELNGASEDFVDLNGVLKRI